MESVLVICRNKEALQAIISAFPKDSRVDRAANPSRAMTFLKKNSYEFVFIDIDILQASYPDLPIDEALTVFRKGHEASEFIVMSSKSQIRQMVKALKFGAADYLTYPVEPEEVALVLKNLRESMMLASELAYLRERHFQEAAYELIDSQNTAMIKVFNSIRMVAPTRTPILLVGETGVGKGVLARLIHRQSHRKNAQFISVHCGAIPETLVENELFGHEKGAFTGAGHRKLGKFEIASEGTIFLDEIGTVTPLIQIKLLQVLQDGTFSRLGGEEELKTQARVIAATNADLKQMSQEGQFRKDLYYRLNVFPIEIPPLRKRLEDIPFFVEMFLKKLNRLYCKEIKGAHPSVIDALMHYSWPGNIRELENLIERAYIVETSRLLTPESFSVELIEAEAATKTIHSGASLAEGRRRAVEVFEKQYLTELLARHRGRVKSAAADAGVSTRQLSKLMLKYALRKEVFK
ncbi:MULTISPECIES: sigma-54 interaction domain-containing protein [Desulfococcus]|uniref:Putative two component, sigma54 specific, transcriptional regulator n=1 Tax=Desulfococcus multivorans DSM 2059 TaxID=1121405 RepID=S7V2Z1_DESML|nr:sigma-54 dependent transcriptional regulator [Desulfococcus multivorans]AOY57940.1 two component system response regulator, sigma54-specific [Desulfococcus multivorans]AQV00311.1 Fis family transcriptional regulator [Desulfococcus multivorans]EPR39023.1 putative two component, sigma54 specific, transcriptional regulator [Desulfococcus multivorans DSM 2059]SJZ64918.1 DNA-binding transcriptional response regulator, NtrC family, contains REC, AAA-type ATPase, and a Fis-type DNA-binding domains 